MNFNFIKTAAIVSAVSAIFASSLICVQAQTSQTPESTASKSVNTQVKTVSAPSIMSLKSTVKGLEIKWTSVEGAVKYAVYRKTKNTSAKLVSKVSETTYYDRFASSGEKYYYLIKCVDENDNFISDFSKSKSLKYIKTPVINKISNTSKGSVITWSKVKGAKKYSIYYLKNKKWKKLATVKASSYTHKKLTSGKTYTYRVRALNSKGKFIGGYDYKGTENLYVASPVISSAFNNADSISVKWNKVKGAAAYNVYRKTGDGKYKKIDSTDTNKFVDKEVSSGKKYTYTVRCVDADGKFLSSSSASKSVKFVKAPEIISFTNVSDGTKITWSKSAGASKYAVYSVDSKNKLKLIATVSSTSYTHTGLKDGTAYTYTVRALDKKGKTLSTVRKALKNLYIAPVKLSDVSSAENGVLIKWNKINGADKYVLFRMKENTSWEKIYSGDELSFTDTTSSKDTLYQYSLRCMDKDGEYISYIDTNAAYYYNGTLANGEYKIGGKSYKFINGYFRRGIQVIDGKTYYYDSEGNLLKNGIVGSEKDGWYYADKNGVINLNYVNGIKDKNGSWIIINGKARKVATKSDKTLFRAAKEVAKATKPTMTQSEKLRACFNYVKKAYNELNPRIPHYNKKDWPILYANDMFVDGAGNCFSYAAAFAYMARAIGYTNVYCCHSGGHGWAEIDGKIYDPEWSRHHKDKSYFGLTYSSMPHYKSAIKKSVPWMYVKIK